MGNVSCCIIEVEFMLIFPSLVRVSLHWMWYPKEVWLCTNSFAKRNQNTERFQHKKICCLQRSGSFYNGSFFPRYLDSFPGSWAREEQKGRKILGTIFFPWPPSYQVLFLSFPSAGRQGWILIVYNYYNNEHHNQTFLLSLLRFTVLS